MVEVEFSYKQQITIVQCQLNSRMKDIYNKLISKAKIDINSIYFICSGNKIDNNELTIDQLININDRSINKMKILVESIIFGKKADSNFFTFTLFHRMR